MAYAEVDIINMALQRLGEQPISSAEWASPSEPQTEAANNVFQYIRDEVLEARDWVFAKSRTILSQIPPQVALNAGENKIIFIKADKWLEDTEDISIELVSNDSDALDVSEDSSDSTNIVISLANSTDTKNTAALIQTGIRALTTVNGVSVASWAATANAEWTASPPTADVDLNEVDMLAGPYGTYDRAYKIPSDFLRVSKPKDIDRAVDPTGAVATIFDNTGMIVTKSSGMYPYAFESLEDDTFVLVTDYDATESYPLELVYLRTVTDVTKWSAHFISALAFRLAAELSFIIPESGDKFRTFFNLYESIALPKAAALNQSFDYVQHETGSEEWQNAGRS